MEEQQGRFVKGANQAHRVTAVASTFLWGPGCLKDPSQPVAFKLPVLFSSGPLWRCTAPCDPTIEHHNSQCPSTEPGLKEYSLEHWALQDSPDTKQTSLNSRSRHKYTAATRTWYRSGRVCISLPSFLGFPSGFSVRQCKMEVTVRRLLLTGQPGAKWTRPQLRPGSFRGQGMESYTKSSNDSILIACVNTHIHKCILIHMHVYASEYIRQ